MLPYMHKICKANLRLPLLCLVVSQPLSAAPHLPPMSLARRLRGLTSTPREEQVVSSHPVFCAPIVSEATASPKQLEHARQLLTEHGEARTYLLLAYAQQAAHETADSPQTFDGIVYYLPRALTAYDVRATQAPKPPPSRPRPPSGATGQDMRCEHHEASGRRYLVYVV